MRWLEELSRFDRTTSIAGPAKQARLVETRLIHHEVIGSDHLGELDLGSWQSTFWAKL
jgi:hypothetical protein